MQTGYDSYWMYQNSRPGPLHNLQNNNYYSNAVFTDSNRHVQNGRILNHYNNSMQPPNNVAYYHQNSQYRNSDFHQMPSSMYPEPFRPSNVSNTQPRRTSVNWSSRSGYLPHNSYTHENFRYSENYTKFSQVSSCTEKTNVRVNPAPASGNIRQISRIRVKDVYSINNNNISDSFLHKTFPETHSKRHRESVINYGSNNYSAVDLDSQNRFIDNTYLVQHKLPPPYYRHTASEQPQQSCPQFESSRQSKIVSKNNTSGFVPQEINPDKYSPDNILQRACANEKASEITNSGQFGSVQTYDQITHGIFNTSNSSQIQNCRQNELENTAYLETLSSSRVSPYGTLGNSNVNNVLTNCHENVSKNDGANLASFNSPKTSRTNLNRQVTSNPETSSHYPRQEGTLIKISIPHTGQSSFIRLNDSNTTINSSNLSLPCLLDSNNEYINAVAPDRLFNNNINVNDRKNSSVFQTTTSENTCNSPPTSVESSQNFGTSHLNNSSLIRKVLSPKQSFINVNKENTSSLVSNSAPQNDLSSKTGSTNVSKVGIPKENIKLNLSIKQEKFLTSAESLREDDHGISGNDELDKIIRKEKIPVEETFENSAPFSENLNTLEKSSPALEGTGNSDSIEVKTFPKIPKDIPLENPESKSSKVQRLKKKDRQHISYKSKINRVKLDMLIQFLKTDDEPVPASSDTPSEKTTNENIECKTREKHRIRKLSKTSIVRNKNISREMVSLVSQKTSRVDHSKSSSGISHTVKPNVDSPKGKEGKENSEETDENLKNENSTSSFEHQPQKEDPSQSERNIKKELVTGELQDPALKCLTAEKDKEVINMMRILRTMTTNFCTNCKLSSSVNSFWVNVVSFELRCLNCFKKFLPKEFSTKNCGYDTGKQELHSGNESNLKDIDNLNSVNSISKELQQEKSNNLKENLKISEDSSKGRRQSFEKSKRKKLIKEEDMTDERQNSEENVPLEKRKKKNSSLPNSIREKSERKSSSSEESADEILSKKSISKDQNVDNKSPSKNECKSEKLLRTPSKKVEDKEDIRKNEKKGNVETPKRKSSTESTPNKTSVPDECAKKEGKRLMDSREKDRNPEQPKISKSRPEMSEISQTPSKSKPTSNDSERKKSLKRKHSNDDPSPRKIYISDEHSNEKKETVGHSPDKTKSTPTTSKDVNQKTKPETENQISKTPTDKSKDVTSQKINSTETDDSLKSPRRRTPRDDMKQNKDKKHEKEKKTGKALKLSDKDNGKP